MWERVAPPTRSTRPPGSCGNATAASSRSRSRPNRRLVRVVTDRDVCDLPAFRGRRRRLIVTSRSRSCDSHHLQPLGWPQGGGSRCTATTATKPAPRATPAPMPRCSPRPTPYQPLAGPDAAPVLRLPGSRCLPAGGDSVRRGAPNSLWGESEANRDRQTQQQRRTRPAGRDRPRTRRFRSRLGWAPLPRPRESAVFSRMLTGCGREVSATAD